MQAPGAEAQICAVRDAKAKALGYLGAKDTQCKKGHQDKRWCKYNPWSFIAI